MGSTRSPERAKTAQARIRPLSASASINSASTPRVSSLPVFGLEGSRNKSRNSGVGGAVSRLPSEVDDADEGTAIVAHDRLLMVAVQGPLFRVDAALDPSLLRKLVAHPRHLAARRTEERQRRSRPHEHTHLDALGEVGEQVAQHDKLLAAD